MTIPGFDAAQSRYDGATPPDGHDCPDAPDECRCVERDEDLRDSALIARQDAEDGR